MKSSIRSGLRVVALGAAMAMASGASAQSAGQFTLKGGIGKITPKVDSGDVTAPALPGTKTDIGSETQPIFSVGYGLTDNVSVELELGLPLEHKIYGAGAIADTGQIASVKVSPPTLLVQYRFFKPDALFRPYAGLGVTYVYFSDETGSGRLTAISDIGGPPTTFSIENKLAATVQFGLVVNINARWFADLAYTRTRLKTKVRFSSGQTQDLSLDPESVSLGVGYKF